MGDEPRLIYCTVANQEQASAIARALVERRLVACVNLLPAIESWYWWQGAVQHDLEVAFVAKTVERLVPEAVEAIRSLHSYTCPCVIALPITGGNPAFIDWIAAEVKRPV